MTLTELENWLNNTLQPELWKGADAALNGLQVARREARVGRVAFAVDASLQSFERAADAGADALVVHHGLWWGQPLALTGDHYRRVRSLLDHDLALFAYHLPLDAHPTLGNNAGMATALGLGDLQPFGEYKGRLVGVRGTLPEPRSLEELCDTLFHGRENVLQLLPFGKNPVRTVGLVSGGATREVADAIRSSLDVFITGDADHTVYHTCLEAGINLISGGHYATETWGVRLLAQHLQKETGVPTVFLDLPTGL
ncbi:MAG: Nif3-like dinuclear metal center hexameric protein [Spirochaetales bacterium]